MLCGWTIFRSFVDTNLYEKFKNRSPLILIIRQKIIAHSDAQYNTTISTTRRCRMTKKYYLVEVLYYLYTI